MSENERLPSPINLKHRIIGAVILVSLRGDFSAHDPERTRAADRVQGHQRDSGKGTASEAPPPSTSDDSRDGGGRAASGTAAEYALPEPPPEPAALPAPATKPAAPAPAKAPAGGARPAKGWVVQVGIFANAANAARLGDKLKAQGHEVMLENITQNNESVRLRVGPFADKSAAQQAQTKIQQDARCIGCSGLLSLGEPLN